MLFGGSTAVPAVSFLFSGAVVFRGRRGQRGHCLLDCDVAVAAAADHEDE